jgi:hypothetical protein
MHLQVSLDEFTIYMYDALSETKFELIFYPIVFTFFCLVPPGFDLITCIWPLTFFIEVIL